MSTPRGVANKNPGNLQKNGNDKWQGLSKEQNDPSFFQFDSAVYGIRALARTLLAYQDRNSCECVSDLISRWAPPMENNTEAYISAVCALTGVGRHACIDLHKYAVLRALTEAIILQENGSPWTRWYTEAEMVKAMVLAGVEPEKRSLMASPQVIGSTIAAAATAAGPVVQQVQTQLQPLADYSDISKHVFIGAALLGALVTIISKYNERKKGIS